MSIFEMTETKHGRMVVLAHDTYISRSLVEYGEWTESEFDLMRQALVPGDVVIDVGANIGALTLPFANAVGPTGQVFAFEPQPRIFQLLATNCVLNDLTNVRLFNVGCAAAPGSMDLAELTYMADYNYGALKMGQLAEVASSNRDAAGAMMRRTPLVTLDETFDGDRLKLIKIDVEGMEPEVLRGASGIINRFRPALYVENEFPDSSAELIGTLQGLGYDAYWHIAPCFNPQNSRGRKDNIFGPVSCVNMLCVPAERGSTMNGLSKVGHIDEHPRKAA